MNIRTILVAAGMVGAAMGIGTAAEARPHHDARWEQRYHDNGRHNGWDRRDRRGWNRHAYNQPRRCWTEWRHHRRVRICR